MPGVIVDIGTGDGKFTYQIAKKHPDRLVIGIDPNLSGLKKTSAKIYKKPARGGLKNALFVLATIEDLPTELDNLANQVFINFPWGSLLKGIVLVEDKTWKNIKRICQEGALVDILFGYDEAYEEKEIEKLGVPFLSQAYIKGIMSPKLKQKGFRLIEIKEIGPQDLKDYPSSWAKKLRFRKGRKYYFLRVEA